MYDFQWVQKSAACLKIWPSFFELHRWNTIDIVTYNALLDMHRQKPCCSGNKEQKVYYFSSFVNYLFLFIFGFSFVMFVLCVHLNISIHSLIRCEEVCYFSEPLQKSDLHESNIPKHLHSDSTHMYSSSLINRSFC